LANSVSTGQFAVWGRRYVRPWRHRMINGG
jgi:hypothetical protein